MTHFIRNLKEENEAQNKYIYIYIYIMCITNKREKWELCPIGEAIRDNVLHPLRL